ncbi:MAG: hypothetical protein AB7O73_04105 [Bacteroidia bacterium]
MKGHYLVSNSKKKTARISENNPDKYVVKLKPVNIKNNSIPSSLCNTKKENYNELIASKEVSSNNHSHKHFVSIVFTKNNDFRASNFNSKIQKRVEKSFRKMNNMDTGGQFALGGLVFILLTILYTLTILTRYPGIPLELAILYAALMALLTVATGGAYFMF